MRIYARNHAWKTWNPWKGNFHSLSWNLQLQSGDTNKTLNISRDVISPLTRLHSAHVWPVKTNKLDQIYLKLINRYMTTIYLKQASEVRGRAKFWIKFLALITAKVINCNYVITRPILGIFQFAGCWDGDLTTLHFGRWTVIFGRIYETERKRENERERERGRICDVLVSQSCFWKNKSAFLVRRADQCLDKVTVLCLIHSYNQRPSSHVNQ